MYSNHHVNKRREHKSSECSCSMRPPPKGVYKNPSYSYTNLHNIDTDVDNNSKLPFDRAYNNNKMSRCVSHIESTDALSWFEADRLNKPGKLRDSQDNYSLPPLELTYRQETCFVIKKTPERRHHTSLLSENGNSSLNLNCKHYCSTYYKREPPEYFPYYTESTQKNISRLMASVKNYVDEISENKFKDMDIRDDEYSPFQYEDAATNAQYGEQLNASTLRERKAKNNNISPCYGQDRRPVYTDNGYANDNEASSAANIYLSGYNSSELSLPNEAGLKESKKKKNRFASIQSADTYDLDSSNSWIDISNNNVEEARPPKATFRKRTESGTAKKSPTSHRVLLYGNQSPILSRLSPMKKQEYKKLSSRAFEHKKGAKRWNVEEENSYVRFSDTPEDYEVDSNNLLNRGKIQGKHDGYYETTLSDDDTIGDSCDSGRSSDSEDGYRSNAYKFAHLLGSPDKTHTYQTADKSEVNLQNPPALLVPSLFPNVPPYIAFSSSMENGPCVTPELHRVLKWKVTNVMPKVVRSVLVNSGMRLVKKTNDWMGTWGKHMKSPCFKAIRPYQKVNHLPGSFKIGRKDSCWKNLQKQMCKYGKKDYGFMPKTYVIPHDLKMLRKNWPRYSQRSLKWIIKPPASARGTGIRVVDRWAQIPKRRPLIVQKYIERPLLINGSKFDLRLYVLVTSINPLRVYMYDNGLVRFASVKYSDKSDTLHDRCMHLTNYSINKLSQNYSKNDDVNACHGHKWSLHSLWSYLENRGIRTDCLWKALQNLVLRTLIAGEHSINNMIKMNVESKYSCFELFGFDVLLDAELIPWLLEVNISPSLHSELPLDAHVKAPLIQGVLNTALYNVPPKLSMEKQREISASMSLPAGPICFDKRIYINNLSRTEKIKHSIFTRRSLEDREEYVNEILVNLTPDDVRCLIVAEDELARSAPLQRIFPTTETHKYLKYTEAPRYYNRLLDAWESRYGNNRNEGIEYLRKFCEEKYHLEIPPSPVKKFSFSRDAFV